MAVKVQYDLNGMPASAYVDGGIAIFTSAASGAPKGKKEPTAGTVPPNRDEEAGATRWVDWGDSNDFPREVVAKLRKSGVASQALLMRSRMLYGQRVIPCKVKDFDPNTGKETLEFVNDPEINDFLRRSNINEFRGRALQDYVTLANSFPMLVMNADRSKISMVAHDKASKFRYAPFDTAKGRMDLCYRSANWPSPTDNQLEKIKVINSYYWSLEVERIRQDNAIKYVYPIHSYDMLNDYYSIAQWDGIRSNGWLDIANSIPQYKKAIFKNQTTIKYHVRIPLSYWKSLYPDFDRLKQKERDSIVNGKLQEINDYLTGSENAMKTFISHYATDPTTGKEIAGWDIVALDDKVKGDAYLPDATAANAEILFAIGVNPAIFGLGTPGGAHAGGSNNGGSNIRESWLTMTASAQMERDQVYGWWDFVKAYNGYDPEVELRTIDKVLTTLDKGKGTERTVS